ncbi:MAG: D-gamma-glutamyl-meso-diaminopimelic acid endopeptidase CwlS precursor [Bacteroidota bacterium]|jgi:LysM repeat protein
MQYRLLLIFLLVFQFAQAQITAPIQKIDGVEYYMHKVEQGQTLYSISKLYNVGVKEIQKSNQLGTEGIQLGQILKVRKGGSGMPHPTEQLVVPEQNNAYLNVPQGYHLVRPGETAYSIAMKYKISLEQLYAWNPGSEDGIGIDDQLKISDKAIASTQARPVKVNTDKLKIYLLLPFYSGVPDSVISARQKVIRETALQIYRGMLLATDTLAAQNIKMDIEVVDFADNVTLAKEWTQSGKFNDADFLVGPLFKESLEVFAQWGKSKGVWVICPVPISNKVLMGNDHLIKAFPSDVSQWGATARFVATHKKATVPVYLYAGKTEVEKKKAEAFKGSYTKAGFKNIVVSGNMDSLIQVVSTAKDSTVLIFPTAQADGVRKLNKKAVALKKCWVVGLPEWQDILSEGDYDETVALNQLSYSFPKANEADLEDEWVRPWVKKYHRQFFTHPNEYAMCSFDLIQAIADLHKNYQGDLATHGINYQGLSSNIQLIQVGRGNGYENIGVLMLHAEKGVISRTKP